jgi:RNA polymerase sigma-70 factor (ECF subfamily)
MPDRRCREIFAALSQYLDGELRVKECSDLERHLQGCQPCLAYIENLKTTIGACHQFRTRKAPKPSARVRHALREAMRKR